MTKFEKEFKKQKEELRAELFAYAASDYEGKEYLLPITTVTVPKTFWYTTDMDPQEFLASRFPTWDLQYSEEDPITYETTFILRKKPEYMPFSYEDDNLKLSKSSTEPTPEVDWETLKQEREDLFEQIVQETVVYELNGDRLQELINEDKETLAIFQRHTRYTRDPQQRVSIKGV
jgi:hypothetical protein